MARAIASRSHHEPTAYHMMCQQISGANAAPTLATWHHRCGGGGRSSNRSEKNCIADNQLSNVAQRPNLFATIACMP